MFGGFWQHEPSTMDEAAGYIERIQAQDPDWPSPNYDVEDLADLNTSFVLLIRGATEAEVVDEVDYFRPDARGYLRLPP